MLLIVRRLGSDLSQKRRWMGSGIVCLSQHSKIVLGDGKQFYHTQGMETAEKSSSAVEEGMY